MATSYMKLNDGTFLPEDEYFTLLETVYSNKDIKKYLEALKEERICNDVYVKAIFSDYDYTDATLDELKQTAEIATKDRIDTASKLRESVGDAKYFKLLSIMVDEGLEVY